MGRNFHKYRAVDAPSGLNTDFGRRSLFTSVSALRLMSLRNVRVSELGIHSRPTVAHQSSSTDGNDRTRIVESGTTSILSSKTGSHDEIPVRIVRVLLILTSCSSRFDTSSSVTGNVILQCCSLLIAGIHLLKHFSGLHDIILHD